MSKELTTEEKISEAKRLAEYTLQGVHMPDYRTSIALSSIALSLSLLLDFIPDGGVEAVKTEINNSFDDYKLSQRLKSKQR